MVAERTHSDRGGISIRNKLNIVAVVAGNLVPLWAVYVEGWNPLIVILIYWLETVIIGLVTTIKLVAALRGYRPKGGRRVCYRQQTQGASCSFNVDEMSRLAVVPFFVLFYSLFSIISLVLSLVLIVEGPFAGPRVDLPAMLKRVIDDWPIWVPLVLMLVFDHAATTVNDYSRSPEWARSDPNFHLWRPMGRFVVFFVLILGGAFLMQGLQMHWLVVVFVALKMTGELFSLPYHNVEWERTFDQQTSSP